MKRHAQFALITMSTTYVSSAEAQAPAGSSDAPPLTTQNRIRLAPQLRITHFSGNIAEMIQQAFQLHSIDVVFAGIIRGSSTTPPWT